MSNAFDTEDESDRKNLLDCLKEINAGPDFQAGLTVEEKLEIETRRGIEKSRSIVRKLMEI